MLSQLSKGYGSWTAGYVDPYFGDKKERECTLPEIDQESHSHGVTVGPRSGRSTAMSWVTSKRSREPTIDGIPLPKTYTTRKGALQLYVGPDDLDDDDDDDDNDEENELYSLKPKYVQVKRPHGQELIDLSLKLGTMERLAMSVLQFGDEDYDHEHTSVTDSKNKAFLKFLHSVDEAPTKVGVDSHVQPGGDLKKYLKDLKTKAGARFGSMYVSKSRESLELQAILRGLDNSSWPLSYSQDGASEKSGTGQFTRPVSRVSSRGPSPGPPSTPRSSYQVLSAKKVAASIRSGSYLGRPSSRIDEIYDENVSEAKSIRSTKSGRKSQSKKTKSVLESEDGGDEYKLPLLESDRLMEKDGINSEDIQTANGEQTGFSGSSVSYSDILVDDKLSELEIVSQSRNSSTQKLSRPSSVILDEDVPQGELDHIENTSSKPDQADEMSDNGGSDKDYANAEENERNHDESALLKNEGSPIEDVDDKQTDKELSALEKEDLEKEVDNVVSEIDQTQSPEALQLEENVEQSEDDLIVAKVEMKVLVEIEGKDRLDEAKADAPDKSVIEESSLITELKTSVPDADVTPPIAEKDEPEIKTTVESPQVIEKKQEAQKQMKTVTDNLENKSTVPKTTLKTEQKPVKTSKSGNAGKTSVVAGNKNGYKTKSVAPSGNKLKTKVSNQDNTSKTEERVKPKMGSAVLEGEGLLNLESELASKVDEEQGEGLYYDADLDDNARTGEKDFAEYMSDAHAIAAELDALGLTKTKKGSKVYPLLPPGQRPKAPPEKQKIPDHLQDALNRRASESRQYLEEDLERMTAMVGETLSGPTLEAVGEGLTEEELEIAKQILQQKLDEAKGQLDGKPTTKSKGKKGTGKGGKKAGKKKNDPSDDKTKEEIDREAIRARHDHEKQIREQEAADLQRKIAENKRLLKQQADQSSSRSKELLDEMERLEREAADMQQAEDEARQILADERKKQREEREARRKADLERKKQEALDRREREKKEMDDKRRKEMEMMEKIADAEMRRRMREEEERRLDEEERLAQERYEAEMREAQKLEEEEEERLKEMERQAEEEAMQRLIEEREAAERERRRIREEEEAFREAEMRRMEKMAEEHRKLEEERKRLQDIEDAKREAERQNLLKLRQLEEEARIKMQEEIEKRRNEALARRDFNLENKQNVDKLRHYQGITRAWTFSYFVHWPRETYESRLRPKLQKGRRPIGSGDPRKVKIKNPPPKKVDENAAASNTEVPTAIVP